MAGFNTAAFPDSLALGKQDSLLIGTIDEIQVRGRKKGWRGWGWGAGGGGQVARGMRLMAYRTVTRCRCGRRLEHSKGAKPVCCVFIPWLAEHSRAMAPFPPPSGLFAQ